MHLAQVGSVNITGNLIYDVGDGGVYFHCGTDNSAENNMVAATAQQGARGKALGLCNRGGNPMWPNLPHGFELRRNIFWLDRPELTMGTDGRNITSNWNLFWDTQKDHSYLTFPNQTSWTTWRAEGHDGRSLIADPEFYNVSAWDLRLRRTSPAFRLGFIPIDVARAGCHDNPFQTPARGFQGA